MDDSHCTPRIRRIGRTVFQVSSRSRAGLWHTIDVLHLRCDCEAGRYGRRCWHLVWALQAEYWLNWAASDQMEVPA
jgi:hypothetical protein